MKPKDAFIGYPKNGSAARRVGPSAFPLMAVTPNGPVIDAVVQATLLDANINSWGDLNFLVREVTDSGELEPIDLPQVARVFEAAREDEKAEAAGVIGISQKLERRARQSQRWQPSTGQLETLYKTAEHLILASYLGGRPIGVNIQRCDQR